MFFLYLALFTYFQNVLDTVVPVIFLVHFINYKITVAEHNEIDCNFII